METNELKIIWKTLADEKLIDQDLADENIERIISQKSSKTIAKLTKKLKFEFTSNIIVSAFIVVVTIFAIVFNKQHNHTMPIESYIFLFLAFAFFVFKSITMYSKINLFKLSVTTSSIKESLIIVKEAILRTYKKEKIITYIAFLVIVIFANIVLNAHNGYANFKIHSLQGYVLIISIVSLILPWLEKYILKNRFSSFITIVNNFLFRDSNQLILKDVNHSLKELEEL